MSSDKKAGGGPPPRKGFVFTKWFGLAGVGIGILQGLLNAAAAADQGGHGVFFMCGFGCGSIISWGLIGMVVGFVVDVVN
jgi:hypothetical protein